MDKILITKDLCKNYRQQKANDNISINVRANSIYGLISRACHQLIRPTVNGWILFSQNYPDIRIIL